jgi:hypothetical protein
MDIIKKQKLLKPLILLPAFLLLGCTSPKKQSNHIIHTKIADEQITAREFSARSNFMFRPAKFKSKNTVLITFLISEKNLVLEAQENSRLLQTPAFQSMLKDIQEKSMRYQLHYEVAFNNVELYSHEISNASRPSIGEYELAEGRKNIQHS